MRWHRLLHNIHAMTSKLTKAVKAAIDKAPCSVNKLAEDSGVPQSTLSRIRAGKLGATPDVARRVAKALKRWGDDCQKAAESIHHAKEG